MALSTYIADIKNGDVAEVVNGNGEVKSLAVATRPQKTYLPNIYYLDNDTYGRDMNQNAAFGGTPIYFHNGTDDTYKTFSEPVGTKAVEDSTDQAYAGTKSIKWDKGNIGDIVQIAEAGTDITVSGYAAFTLWVYVDKDWLAGDSVVIQGYDVGVGYVGSSVALEDYFSYGTYDLWQFVAIPLVDMGLTTGTIDAIRFEIATREGGKSPKFYMDNIELEESGENISFNVEPDKGTWLHIISLRFAFADVMSGAVSDGTMAGYAYNKLLAATLTNGILVENYVQESRANSWIADNIFDLIKWPKAGTQSFSDGTNSCLFIDWTFPVPLVLKPESRDELRITIRDDLSGLLEMQVLANCFIEDRT